MKRKLRKRIIQRGDDISDLLPEYQLLIRLCEIIGVGYETNSDGRVVVFRIGGKGTVIERIRDLEKRHENP